MPRTARLISAFTLVEVLVVIVILSILVVLAIPAVGKVTAQGKAAKCISNLRQLGIAYRTAALDEGRLFPVYTPNAEGNNSWPWAQYLWKLNAWPGDWVRNPLLLCPMDPRVQGNADFDGYYRSYGQNVALCPNAQTGVPLAAVPEQSKTFLIMDVVKAYGAHPTFGGFYSPMARHGSKCNVLFVDGHVEALAPATITNAPYNWPGTPPETTTNAYRWR